MLWIGIMFIAAFKGTIIYNKKKMYMKRNDSKVLSAVPLK